MLAQLKTAHISPWRASYGVSFVNISAKINRRRDDDTALYTGVLHETFIYPYHLSLEKRYEMQMSFYVSTQFY